MGVSQAYPNFYAYPQNKDNDLCGNIHNYFLSQIGVFLIFKSHSHQQPFAEDDRYQNNISNHIIKPDPTAPAAKYIS